MHPELIAAIKERIALNYSKEAIRDELHAAGYDDQMVEAAYVTANAEVSSEVSVPNIPGPATPNLTPAAVDDIGHETILPGVGEMFQNGWKFMLSRLDLVALLAVPFVILEVVSYVLTNASEGIIITIGLLANLAAMVVYMMGLGGMLFAVTEAGHRRVSWSEALEWGRKHIFSLFWIYLLTVLVIYGGLLLFIIPGIVLSFYVYFGQYVFIKEGARGMEALLRSRDLVRGNGWLVAGKLLGLGLIFSGLVLIVGVLSGVFLGFSPFESGGVVTSIPLFIFGVLWQIASAAALVIATHYGMSIYQWLAAKRPVTAVTAAPNGKWKYIVLAILGLVFPVVMLVLAFSFLMVGGGFSSFSDEYSSEFSETHRLEGGLSTTPLMADFYYYDNGDSYAGVCAALELRLDDTNIVNCADSLEAWALSGEVETGEQYCIDSTTEEVVTGGILPGELVCEPVYESSDLYNNDAVNAKERAAELRAEQLSPAIIDYP